MAANYKGKGEFLQKTASGTVAAGLGVAIGDRAGVLQNDVVSGQTMVIAVDGLYRLAKTSVAMAVGDKLYWDAADANVQKDADSGNNKAIGWAAEDVASGVTSIDVKLGAF